MTDFTPYPFAVTDNDNDTTIGAGDLAHFLDDLGLPADDLVIRMLAGELGIGSSDFEIRIGEWRLNSKVATARALVNGVVLTAALAAKDESSIPATVLSVIVPLVFDLERVAISASDRAVYAALLRDAPDRRAIDDWYSSLPTHLQAEITNLEFQDLFERLEEAGLAEQDYFGVLTLDLPSRRRLRRLSLSQP